MGACKIQNLGRSTEADGAARIDDIPLGIGGGAGLVAAYEHDFTTDANLTINTDDDWTLGDGKVWRSANTASSSLAVVNGEGIHISGSGEDIGNTNTSPRLGTYIGNLTDTNTMAPDVYSQLDLWIWVRASWVGTITPETYDRIIVGFCYAYTKVGTINYGLSYRVRQFSGYHNSATFHQHQQHNTPPNTITSEGYHDWYNYDSPDLDVFVFHVRPGYQVDNYYGQSAAGLFPLRKDLTFCGSSVLATCGAILQGGIISTAFYPHLYFSASGAEILVKRLKVEYLSLAISSGGGGDHEGFTDVTISGGGISGFTSHRTLRVSGTGPLVGIQDTGFADGESITIAFVADTTITGMGATSLVPIKGPFDQETYLSSFTVPAGEEITLRFYAGGGVPFFKYRGGSTV